ncbi:MAG: hypothetical protein ACT4PY_04605 [Armatimonadota bacterium]
MAPPQGNVINVTPAQTGALAGIIAGAAPGDIIRLADGTYPLNGALLRFLTPRVTLRSASGNPRGVILDGNYQGGAIVQINASDITIAEITVQRAFHHPIHIYPVGPTITGANIYRVRVIDPGEQAIKINSNGGQFADRGEIRCSEVMLTDAGRPVIRNNCYTGGIDAHQALGWVIHGNLIEGFWCSVGLSEHGIHVWTGSRDTLVDSNILKNNARGIGFGLGESFAGRTYGDDPCPGSGTYGHFNGVILNNFVFANDTRLFGSQAGFDTGIGLEQACNAQVLHNTVVSTQQPRSSSIEWRFSRTRAGVRNNLASHSLRPRDGGTADLAANMENTPTSYFVDPFTSGDLHLTAGASGARDRAVPGLATYDIDGQTRDGMPDIGADEFR